MTLTGIQFYMNIQTGEVGTYNDWIYTDAEGNSISAVDNGQVVEVFKNENGD